MGDVLCEEEGGDEMVGRPSLPTVRPQRECGEAPNTGGGRAGGREGGREGGGITTV